MPGAFSTRKSKLPSMSKLASVLLLLPLLLALALVVMAQPR